jgi:hypothetical protein
MMEIHLKPKGQMILAYLQAHGSATVNEANAAARTTEARKRISEMIQAGVPIRKEWETAKDGDGNAVRIIRYYLEDTNNGIST